MSNVHAVAADDLRVIMCLAFDHRAPCDEVRDFKRCIVDCPQVLHSIELSGSFDFMLEVSLPNIAAYHTALAKRAEPLAKLVARYEASFICKRFARHRQRARAIWVPGREGSQLLDCALIDKVLADGDYMQVHSGNHRWLVHTTMKALSATLGPADFVRIHRSALVRRDFVDRLLHHGNHWVARLHDGSEYHIAKNQVAAALKAIQGIAAQRGQGPVKDQSDRAERVSKAVSLGRPLPLNTLTSRKGAQAEHPAVREGQGRPAETALGRETA